MAEVLDSNTLKALSNDTRQEIIKLLNKRPHTASELSKKMGKHITTIIEHLEILEKANIIQRRNNGNKWVYYVLTKKGDKLFKPKYYSFVILISLALVAIIVVGINSLYTDYLSGVAFAETNVGVLLTDDQNITQINDTIAAIGHETGRKINIIYEPTQCREDNLRKAIARLAKKRVNIVITSCRLPALRKIIQTEFGIKEDNAIREILKKAIIRKGLMKYEEGNLTVFVVK